MAARTARDLSSLFEPRSLAVVGASNDPAKWGQWLARGAVRGEHRRAVYLVNRSGGEVLGRPAYRSLAELPEAPELVVLGVPAAAFEETVDASLAAGARAIVAIAAGLGESGEDGLRRERSVVERVRAAGAVLLGPNCLGVYDAAAELDLGTGEFAPGPIGLVSQSGNLALEVSLLAAEVGLGISRFASLGNQADLEAAELVASLAVHEGTRAIGLYCEDFRDGRAFARAAAAAAVAGKPVLLLSGGSSAAGLRAARSHTGALVSESVAVDAACRAAGIVRVASPRELVERAQILLAAARPRGRRLAIVTDGGGSAVVAADLAAGLGLELPQLSAGLSARLAAAMPPTATTTNPVDFAGAGEQDLRSYERIPRLLLESGEVDSVLLGGYIGGYGVTSDTLREPEADAARGLARAAAETGRTVVVQTMYWQEPPAAALRAGGVPVYRDVEAALASLACAVGVGERPPAGVPELPPAAPPLAEAGYFEARALLAAGGVPLAEAVRAGTEEEVLAAAEALGYPVVLKALGLVHKSDAGGVAVGLEDGAALTAALAAMAARLSPPGYAVERMVAAPDAVELIVGCRVDPRFGPVLLVGLGGVLAEVLRDTAVALAPAAAGEVELLLRELRGAALLTGVRGRPPLAVEAAAAAAAALSRVAAAHPELAEVEVNPLLVLPDGVVGLDARAVYSQPR
ncbi:MAG TPA: acetate--CoA ligase family protein [Gaiellaceae bacterium]|nr:acetate--CoA ligase family protein [Gaiellaceae bacterium]